MGLRVLFCASEAVPFAKTGGLADVAGSLPPALARLGHDVRLALPKYGSIDAGNTGSRAVGGPFDVGLGDGSVTVSVETSDAVEGVPAYLVNYPAFFARDQLYGYPDDAQRFALFCRAVLQFIESDEWKPQVIHGNDWQTALIPVLLRTAYAGHPELSKMGTLHTIHNLAYQGLFDPSVLPAVGLDASLFNIRGLEFYGKASFLKGGLLFADLLNTVSKKYSEEIQTREYGERLDGVLAQRREDLHGILNGIDYGEWDPSTDRFLAANYGPDDLEGKAADKAAVQKTYNLAERPDVPLIGLVSRLASQKGLDVLSEALPHLLQWEVQFALLGTGEQRYHDVLSRLAERHPDRMGVALRFDNVLAHQIYAGADMFLMPSRYEPCGLGQMISLRYGTIPIVRSTGGLADTVHDFDMESGKGNGFSFEEYSAVALLGAVGRAVLAYKDSRSWPVLIGNAMAADFSWERSAAQYGDLYAEAAGRHRS